MLGFFRKKQKGFTLIELAVVLVILGLLFVIVSKATNGSLTSKAKAQAVIEGVAKMANNWEMISNSCGTSVDPTATAILASPSSANALALLYSGDVTTVQAAYQGCYNSAGVRGLSSVMAKQGTTYNLKGVLISAIGYTAPSLTVAVDNVPTEVALPIYQHFVDQSATAITAGTYSAANFAAGSTAGSLITFKFPQ